MRVTRMDPVNIPRSRQEENRYARKTCRVDIHRTLGWSGGSSSWYWQRWAQRQPYSSTSFRKTYMVRLVNDFISFYESGKELDWNKAYAYFFPGNEYANGNYCRTSLQEKRDCTYSYHENLKDYVPLLVSVYLHLFQIGLRWWTRLQSSRNFVPARWDFVVWPVNMTSY